jgi:hypothetical protein
MSNSFNKIQNIQVETNSLIDSTTTSISIDLNNYVELNELVLELEGLKSELRMIEATDRKLIDVTKQKELRGQIKILEDKIKKIR